VSDYRDIVHLRSEVERLSAELAAARARIAGLEAEVMARGDAFNAGHEVGYGCAFTHVMFALRGGSQDVAEPGFQDMLDEIASRPPALRWINGPQSREDVSAPGDGCYWIENSDYGNYVARLAKGQRVYARIAGPIPEPIE
jgi:hypothetical protein